MTMVRLNRRFRRDTGGGGVVRGGQTAVGSQAGYSMAALLAMMTVMAIVLAVAMPSWNYVIQENKEQELIFRGRQIADAIARFQRKNGNAFPPSMEQLVQGKFLRKAYKDPMTKDGRWRILRPGETGAPLGPGNPFGPGGPRGPQGGALGSPSPTPTPSALGAGSNPGVNLGPVAGVASLSTDKAIRVVNGMQRYNQWIFAPNVPLLMGGQPVAAGPVGGANQVPARAGIRAPDVESPRFIR